MLSVRTTCSCQSLTAANPNGPLRRTSGLLFCVWNDSQEDCLFGNEPSASYLIYLPWNTEHISSEAGLDHTVMSLPPLGKNLRPVPSCEQEVWALLKDISVLESRVINKVVFLTTSWNGKDQQAESKFSLWIKDIASVVQGAAAPSRMQAVIDTRWSLQTLLIHSLTAGSVFRCTFTPSLPKGKVWAFDLPVQSLNLWELLSSNLL